MEYLTAAVGEYLPGQLLAVADGVLAPIAAALNSTPPYLCLSHKVTTAEDAVLPVSRVRKDAIYETALAAAAASAAVGGKLQVAAGGLLAAAGAGSFEIVSLDGKAAGDVVRGRFV